MSSIVDAALHSDPAGTAPAATPGSTAPTPRTVNRSSVGPRALPSESNGMHSDAGADSMMADDEIVERSDRRRALGPRADIPRVVDVTGETLAQRFEEFLET